mgnify:CR=1 FL=1
MNREIPDNKINFNSKFSISIRELNFSYDNNILFEDFNHEFTDGKITAILGKSGIGKSSLLKLIANILKPKMGKILFNNSKSKFTKIAYMDQSDLLLPWLSVIKNVDLGSRLTGSKSQYTKAKQILKNVGLEEYSFKMPDILSGGMRQRVALARTLMQADKIILMDEPFSALDALTRYKIQALSAKLLKDKTVIFITHDPLEALRLANNIIVLDGKPIKVKYSLKLNEDTPRELNSKFVTDNYQNLMQKLQNNNYEI